MHKEIEIKLELAPSELQLLQNWLTQNSIHKGVIDIYDTYLQKEHGSGTHPEYVRVRKTSTQTILCFKKTERDKETQVPLYSHEYEVIVSDANKAIELFYALGFTNKIVLEKKRDIYLYDNFEIVIDRIKTLGTFVEIEWRSQDAPSACPQDIHTLIYELLKTIGITKFSVQKKKYIEMASPGSRETLILG